MATANLGTEGGTTRRRTRRRRTVGARTGLRSGTATGIGNGGMVGGDKMLPGDVPQLGATVRGLVYGFAIANGITPSQAFNQHVGPYLKNW